jgi:hypothetical protein
MDTLHTVIRSIRGETEARRDHVSVFREFLDHLGRIGRGGGGRTRSARGKANGRESSRAVSGRAHSGKS